METLSSIAARYVDEYARNFPNRPVARVLVTGRPFESKARLPKPVDVATFSPLFDRIRSTMDGFGVHVYTEGADRGGTLVLVVEYVPGAEVKDPGRYTVVNFTFPDR